MSSKKARPTREASNPGDGHASRLNRREWELFLDFAIPFGYDALKGLLVLLMLFVFGWVFHLMKLYGVEEKYVVWFESLHFWASASIYLALILDFLGQMYTSFTQKDRRV